MAVDALGQTFDPNLHEAVSVEEREGAAGNEVVGQLQKGYTLKDRLLRPAMVVVAEPVEARPGAAGAPSEERLNRLRPDGRPFLPLEEE